MTRSQSALLLCLCLALGACARDSDQAQIRNLIERAEVAAESRNTSDVIDLVADDYRDAQGFDKAQLQSFLRAYFITHPKIELLISIGDIEMETATRARVRVDIALVGTRNNIDGAPPAALTADAESFDLELQRTDRWLITRADRVRE